jgi:NAD-dependent dihydropyrimidine dehydrogenase PreA subunit
MIKRFCDSCEEEIPTEKIYLDIMLTPKIDGDEAKTNNQHKNYYGDYCTECVRAGHATRLLMKEYVDDLSSKNVQE